MASIYQHANKDGSKVWRAVIRLKGHPSVCEHFPGSRKPKTGPMSLSFRSNEVDIHPARQKKTLADLIEAYIQDAVIRAPQSCC